MSGFGDGDSRWREVRLVDRNKWENPLAGKPSAIVNYDCSHGKSTQARANVWTIHS